jgi:hypothetical protein
MKSLREGVKQSFADISIWLHPPLQILSSTKLIFGSKKTLEDHALQWKAASMANPLGPPHLGPYLGSGEFSLNGIYFSHQFLGPTSVLRKISYGKIITICTVKRK